MTRDEAIKIAQSIEPQIIGQAGSFIDVLAGLGVLKLEAPPAALISEEVVKLRDQVKALQDALEVANKPMMLIRDRSLSETRYER